MNVGPGPRARFASRVASGLIAALLVAACQPSTSTRDTADTRSGDGADWCQDRPEPITCIVDDGQLIGLVRHAGTAEGLVLWDPGGPGLALPDADTPIERSIPPALADRNVLFVVEPWVRTPPPEACLAPEAIDHIRSGTCDLAQFTSTDESLARTVQRAESTTGLRLTGAYLQSFGATRALSELYSGRLGNPRWVVLESPGPPAGTPAEDLFRARADMVLEVLTDACTTNDCDRAVTKFVTVGLHDRSAGRETALGLIALGSVPTANRATIDRFADEVTGGSLSSEIRQGIDKLGRQYSGQLHGGTLPPWLIALWADTCPRLTGWTDVEGAREPLEAAYTWLFRGCLAARGMPQFNSENFSPAGIPVLMLTGRKDAVVPPSVQRLWLAKGVIPNTTLLGVEHRWHSSQGAQAITDWIERQESKTGPQS